MEREILFRGKHDPKYGIGWCYGVPYIDNDGDCILATNINRRVVIKETVGQYTGLTDKNGVKIFEGDILRSNNNPKDIRQVIFGEFMVIDFETESETDEVTGWYCDVIPTDTLSRTRPFCLTLPLTDYYIHQCNMEVVSNIHDNPEMLKGET